MIDPPRQLLECAGNGDGSLSRTATSRAYSLLAHLQIASSDPAWHPPAWHGAAITLTCSILRGAPEEQIIAAWQRLIDAGATVTYITRVLNSLEEL